MYLETLKYFFERTYSQNPAFIYRGVFEDHFSGLILDMAEIRNDVSPQENALNRKVTFMLVECFQNILRHAENLGEIQDVRDDEGMFCFKNFSDGFVINSVNVIKNEEVDRLKSLVIQVNSMTEDDLKNYYLERLENNELSGKGGAGLGLIELARKSGQKILYQIEPLGNGFSLFHQQVTLILGKEDIQHRFKNELEENNKVYSRMIKDGLHLVYKGDVSNRSLLPILDFLRAHVGKSSKLTKRLSRAAHVLIEVSQNITKSGLYLEDGNSGIIMLGEKNGRTVILSGNLIGLSDKILLEEKLGYLISLEPHELSELHKRTLQASLRFESKYNSGLGLIEIAKAGSEPVSFDFYPIGNDRFLYALAVVI